VDIFTFGVVLYEMLERRRPFEGTSPAAVIAATMAGSPAPLTAASPHSDDLEWVVRTCLARNPADRWQSMADVATVLKRIARRSQGAAVSRGPSDRTRMSSVAVAALLLLPMIGFGAARIWTVAGSSARDPIAFSVAPPAGGTFTPTDGSVQTPQLSLSPGGEQLAFVATGADSISRIWIRSMGALSPRPIPGTEDALYPFWSPDGRSIGFFARGMLKRIDLNGGPARTLAAASYGRGGSWNRQGEILFAASTIGVIYAISADGGTPQPRTRLDPARGHTSHRWPHFLPDGRRFLYFARADSQGEEGIYLASLDDTATTFITHSSFGGAYVEPGWVLYLSDGMLLAPEAGRRAAPNHRSAGGSRRPRQRREPQ
jgi:hypothetical protein